MSELKSALDDLLTIDLHGLTSGQTLERAAVLLAARNRLDAELARTIRHAELTQAPEHDGLVSIGRG